MIKSTLHSVRSVVPEWIVEEHHDFIALLESYYKWCESSGQFINESKQLLENYNYELVANNKLFLYKDVFLRLFPVDNPDLIRTLLKFSNVFYSTRGNIESYKFLFKLLWNENIDIEFPSEYILRSSDGEWITDTLINVTSNSSIDSELLLGRELKGLSGRCIIERVNTQVAGESVYLELSVSSITGKFEIDEVVNVELPDEDFTGIILGTYGGYRITNRGKGYLAGAVIPVESTSGTGFSVSITDVDESGRILSISVTPGIGYHYSKPVVDLTHDSIRDMTLSFESAEIEFYTTPVFQSSGYYKTLRSALSDNWKLRDGHYYQEYSYVINSTLKFDTLYRPVIDLLHPAGTVFWFNSENDFSNVSGESRVLWHDTLKIVAESGVEISEKNVQNLVVLYDHTANTDGSVTVNKKYSFDSTGTLDDRVYFSYEKVLMNVIDGEE